jgi:hypothetical protein
LNRLPITKEEVVSQYEVLRRQALESTEGRGSGYGWALLATRGMIAWLRALASYAPLSPQSQKTSECPSVVESRGLSEEITHILTNMALSIRS